MNFLEKLDSLMELYNLNKNTLSQQSGIPYTTIDGWYKKGYEGLKLTTLKKLCSFFDTTLDYFVKDEINDPDYGKTIEFKIDFAEMKSIKKFRSLDDYGKETVSLVLDREYSRSTGSVESINSFADEYAKGSSTVVDLNQEKKTYGITLSGLNKSARNETAPELKGTLDRPFKEILAEDLKNAVKSDDDLK